MNIEFPSVRRLSSNISIELKAGKFVIIRLPMLSYRDEWVNLLAENIMLELHGDAIQTIERLDSEENDTNQMLRELLDCEEDDTLESSLEGDDSLFLDLDMGNKGNEGWNKTLLELAKAIRKTSQHYDTRAVILFLTGDINISELRREAAISFHNFWNMLTWEEMRVFAFQLLRDAESNPLYYSWQVATYSGASNFDPFLLMAICHKRPSSIEQLISLVNQGIEFQKGSSSSNKQSRTSRINEPWKVPDDLMDDWLHGRILGISLERGEQLPWRAVENESRDVYVRKLIWREQMSGLFPVLMEMSSLSVKWVTNRQGGEWKRYLKGDVNDVGYDVIEPATLLDIFDSNKSLPKLPALLLGLLHKLRIIRNKLAHSDAIDSREIKALWDAYLLADNAFGG